MNEDDVPWMYELSKRKYRNFDAVTTEGWYRNTVLKTPLLFLPQRTENAYCISMLTFSPWLPHECTIVLICADDGAQWEAIKLLRSSIDWARGRQAKFWRVSSDTDTDLTMIARRVGATEKSPRFSLSLDQKQ